MSATYEHYYKSQLIYSCVLFVGSYVNFKCPHCGYISAGFPSRTTGVTIFKQNFNAVCIDKVHHNTYSFADQFEGVWEMPKATLSYEALQLDQEGNVVEGAYKIKLEGNFKQHIEPMVKFIKATIPTSERTYDPSSFEWFYHEKWHYIMQTALQGSHFTVNYIVTKEAFTELKRKQAEWAKQAGQTFQTKQYDTDADLELFASLIAATSTNVTNGAYKTWSRDEAIAVYKKAIRFYHPDLHPERVEQASSLNEVWSRLKEGYYIK